jgi:hypothetical protein
MTRRFFRLFLVLVIVLATAAANRAVSQTPRCVVENGFTYCCWPGPACRVCGTVTCYIVDVSDCPQDCPDD